MFVFTFFCKDVTSDSGEANVIIIADSVDIAEDMLKTHLTQKQRLDLIDKMRQVNVSAARSSIMFSNVQSL